MPATKQLSSNDRKEFLICLTAAITTTFFLFFIDEGYYNFKWMESFGNWVAFIIYVVGFLTGQLFAHEIILRFYKGANKLFLTILTGIPFGLIFVLGFFGMT